MMHTLKQVGDDHLEPRTKHKRLTQTYHTALYLLPILTTSLTLWAVLHTWHLNLSPTLNIHHHLPVPVQSHTSSTHRWTTCGSSPDEALSRNCRFDILSFAWQTTECYDVELMQDFIHHMNLHDHHHWHFYTHPNRTEGETVDFAVALEGRRTLFVDWKYHVTHCTFMWRQMHRAYTVRGYVDGHLDNYGHTLHCQGVLLDRETGMDRVSVIAEVKYPECRKIW
ncbi:hypothetical protein N656DRAFT_778666 [Canariomyces notabilis]|uniref:Uncharacterized protein n=1 Tax=Canariomyces notabilis TaxID=2074819 RepID=A0AAN6TFA8_9PEZI|nr:hypothetical protein N656DRAFT_778666 [Canariomyces arenarius]